MALKHAGPLNSRQRRTLGAVCDALIAPLNDQDTASVLSNLAATTDREEAEAFCRRAASDVPGVVESIVGSLEAHAPPKALSEFGLFLNALGTAPGVFAMSGGAAWGAFAELSPDARERVLRTFPNSKLALKRKVFAALKSMICLHAFSGTGDAGDKNPNWGALGYSGPEVATSENAYSSEFLFHTANAAVVASAHDGAASIDDYDAIVIGTGCGGSVVAAKLAESGVRVLVLEKGTMLRRADLHGNEAEGFDRLYERGGIVATEDSGITVFAGSAFGGGSAVNWACSLRTPQFVRQEWASEYGLTSFATTEFDRQLDEVCARLSVTGGEAVAQNRNNQLLLEGAKRCGYPINVAPQNMADVAKGAVGAAEIGIGDRFGVKQSTVETYLQDAAKAGATFIDGCKVDRVQQKGGAVAGVTGTLAGASGEPVPFTARAKVVVVAGGSINSPALLLRSKLPGMDETTQLGRNLRLHPVMGAFGFVPDTEPPVNVWEGAPMTTVCDAVSAGRDGSHYGAKVETPSTLPGVASAQMPWSSARNYKQAVLNLPRAMIAISLCRDKGSGSVTIDEAGEPVIKYRLGAYDRRSLEDGLEVALRCAAAAGCHAIGTGQSTFGRDQQRELPALPTGGEPADARARMLADRAAAVDAAVAEMRRIGITTDYRCGLFSAHQMGTCRMGTSASNSVVGPTGETWAVDNLYVADASVFPTPSGANPMITNMATALGIAEGLVRKLQTAGNDHTPRS